MSNGGKRNYFKGEQWFQAKVNTRVRAALVEKEAQFAIDHKNDTDEELLEYVCAFAKKLGRTPNASEIIGGQYIYRRFGRWENVVSRARLPVPWKAPAPTNRLIFKEEYKRQAALFQQERRDSKEERKKQNQEASRIALEAQKAREERDKAWGQEHRRDTDEQLSEYLRQCARELGHSPFMKEVVGGVYIAKRFVCWPLALTVANLPLPQGMQAPGKKDMEKYRRLQKTAPYPVDVIHENIQLSD